MAKVLILGAGSFGVALALLCHNCGHEVTVWSHRREEAERLQVEREQKKLLPGVKLPQEIAFTATLEAAQACDLAILAVPSFAVRQTSRLLAPHLREGAVVACVAKGLEQGSYADFSTVIGEEIPNCPNVILSGPSHAEEVSRGEATSIVAASHDMEAAQKVQDWLMSPAFRVYVNDDVIGVELGGALKNVMAIAAGVCDGLGLGHNSRAALLTRGLAEMSRIGEACGAQAATFMGLSGLGDLALTCTGDLSRNRQVGLRLGRGERLEHITSSLGMVAEGVKTTAAVYDLARRLGVETPVTDTVQGLLHGGESPREAVMRLMTRTLRQE